MQKPQKKAIQKVNIIGTILSAIAAATVVFFVMNKQLNQCVSVINQQKKEMATQPVEDNKPQEKIKFIYDLRDLEIIAISILFISFHSFLPQGVGEVALLRSALAHSGRSVSVGHADRKSLGRTAGDTAAIRRSMRLG